MPVKGISDRRRLTRIGKIRLGQKKHNQRGVEYPVAVDHFVVRADESTPAEAAAAFHEVYGDEPRELDVVFPTDDPTQWADPWYKMYTGTFGLTCKGDGETARAMWDLGGQGPRPPGVEAGTWATRASGSRGWQYMTIPCLGPECPMQLGDRPACRMTLSLQFLLPNVRGIGVWQIDTSSYNSVRNVLDGIELIKAVTGGRVKGLNLKLRLLPKEVTPQHDKKKTVYVLDLSLPDLSINQLLLQAARLPETGLLLPPPAEEEPPDDLFPGPANGFDPGEVDERTGEVVDAKVDSQLAAVGDLLNRCWQEFGLTAGAVCRILGVGQITEIEDMEDAWSRVVANAAPPQSQSQLSLQS